MYAPSSHYCDWPLYPSRLEHAVKRSLESAAKRGPQEAGSGGEAGCGVGASVGARSGTSLRRLCMVEEAAWLQLVQGCLDFKPGARLSAKAALQTRLLAEPGCAPVSATTDSKVSRLLETRLLVREGEPVGQGGEEERAAISPSRPPATSSPEVAPSRTADTAATSVTSPLPSADTGHHHEATADAGAGFAATLSAAVRLLEGEDGCVAGGQGLGLVGASAGDAEEGARVEGEAERGGEMGPTPGAFEHSEEVVQPEILLPLMPQRSFDQEEEREAHCMRQGEEAAVAAAAEKNAGGARGEGGSGGGGGRGGGGGVYSQCEGVEPGSELRGTPARGRSSSLAFGPHLRNEIMCGEAGAGVVGGGGGERGVGLEGMESPPSALDGSHPMSGGTRVGVRSLFGRVRDWMAEGHSAISVAGDGGGKDIESDLEQEESAAHLRWPARSAPNRLSATALAIPSVDVPRLSPSSRAGVSGCRFSMLLPSSRRSMSPRQGAHSLSAASAQRRQLLHLAKAPCCRTAWR